MQCVNEYVSSVCNNRHELVRERLQMTLKQKLMLEEIIQNKPSLRRRL